MKVKLLCFFSCILVLLITGCTSTYVKNDFPSEADFHNKINKNSGSGDICMINDSSIRANNIKVDHDSVKCEAHYTRLSSDKPSGSYYGPLLLETKKTDIPLNEVKSISFVNHWGPNISYGILSGIAVGGTISGLLLKLGYDSNSGHHTYGFITQAIPGALAGGIIGAITGMLIGNKDQFIFQNYLKEDLDNSACCPRLGIRVGWLSGFNYKIKNMDGVNEYYARVKGEEIPGFNISLLYNYPFSRQISVDGELSYASAGSEARTSVKVPGTQDYYFISSSSDEKLKIIELAVPVRFNLLRSAFSPYLLAGPTLDIVFPGQSGISSFLSDIKKQYNFEGKSISSEYKKWVLGITLGGGISTGRLLPVELLVEARFNYDLTSRFEMNYDVPASDNFHYPYSPVPDANTRMPYGSSDIQLTVGAAIF